MSIRDREQLASSQYKVVSCAAVRALWVVRGRCIRRSAQQEDQREQYPWLGEYCSGEGAMRSNVSSLTSSRLSLRSRAHGEAGAAPGAAIEGLFAAAKLLGGDV